MGRLGWRESGLLGGAGKLLHQYSVEYVRLNDAVPGHTKVRMDSFLGSPLKREPTKTIAAI
jgi:hypothetical protein